MTQDITLSFSIEEMKAFLEKKGYIVEKSRVFILDRLCHEDSIEESIYICHKGNEIVKESYGYFPPDTLISTFTKELKAKLLNL